MPTGFSIAPRLPNMTGAPPMGGVGQDRANIDSLLRGEFDPYEINMQSAERGIGSGTPGSGFAQAGRYRLLDSEKLARQQLGHQELEPYTNREHQQSLQSEAERARMGEIQAESEAAMERLRLSESGQGERLSESERAQLEQIAANGAQSMQLARLNQSGNRDQAFIGGAFNLLGRLGAGGSGGSGGGSTTLPDGRTRMPGGTIQSYGTGWLGPIPTPYGGGPDLSGPARGTPITGVSGGGTDRNVTTLISDILRRYGFRGV